jgi:hypothetical protein
MGVASAGNSSTEGGNITEINLTLNQTSYFWASVVGILNGTVVDDQFPVSYQEAPDPTIYYNEPNGSYAEYFNSTVMLTRIPLKPDPDNLHVPVAADFDEGGMFEAFNVFSGISYSFTESPRNTLCDPCTYMICHIYQNPIACPFINLMMNTPMGILKFDNGTHEEAVFVGTVENLMGYNTTFFDYEFMMPVDEDYYFYYYKEEECNITVWIDDVQTTTFPKSGVPYKVEVLVTDNSSSPVISTDVDAIENNGRNILYPFIELGRQMLGIGTAVTDGSGRAVFVLEPTRYNVPDSYDYMPYIEVNDGAFYCRQNLSIADYSSLSPTYRASLINSTYESQVKASSQNMNSLASTASKWVDEGKMREVEVVAYTNGTYDPLPTLKAGAPNLINITVYRHPTLELVNATADILESKGHIIYVPQQPYKEGFNNSAWFYTNETTILIPTGYNTDANLTISLSDGLAPFATLYFNVDSSLEDPVAGDADMNPSTRSRISSALQNINSVLINIAKSLSTV